MDIKNESDINAVKAKALREKLALNQKEFWGAVCVSGPRGCAYETGRTPIPQPIQRLLFLHYVVGIPVDMSNREIAELAKIADPARRANRKIAAATKMIDEAGTLLLQAKETMNATV